MSKFNELVKQIIFEYSMYDDKVFMDLLNDYSSDKYKDVIEQITNAVNFTLKQYQEKFLGEFDDVTIDVDFFKTSDDIDIFAQVDDFNPRVIRFNVYPILFELKFNNGNIDDLLDLLEFDNPVIGHELAHIADIENRGYPQDNESVHDEEFQKQFKRIVGKDFEDFF